MKKVYNFILFLVIFAGCHKKKISIPVQSSKLNKIEYEQVLAQHSEIPDAQVGFQIDSVSLDQLDGQSLEIIYKPIKKNNRTVQQIKEAYIADMEMLGWQSLAEFQNDGIELIFQKAGKKLLSTIAIESDLRIKIIVYIKK